MPAPLLCVEGLSVALPCGALLDRTTWPAALRAIQMVFQDLFGAFDPRSER